MNRKAPLDAGELGRIAAKVLDNCLERELYPLRDKRPQRPLTHGEQLFLLHGITGIRGEAQRGFPTVLREGLPALRHCLKTGLTLEDAALDALLALMGSCEDSNIMHRKSYSYWEGPYLRLIRDIRGGTVPGSQERSNELFRLDLFFSRERISPGGAADLLTCTLFLHFLQEYPLSLKNFLETSGF
jgi:triphosphoribosyl-dephospho-CoA synthetase